MQEQMEKKHSYPKSFDLGNPSPIDPQPIINAKPHLQNKLGKASSTNKYRKVVKANPIPVEKQADSQQSPINPDSSLMPPAVCCTESKVITVKKEKDTSEAEASPQGDAESGSAKAKLYELCAANKWKLPCFECDKEEGPSHLRQFSFKVTTEVKDESRVTILECFSAPRSKKKAAAEHAAEGALWYLKHLGYSPKKSFWPLTNREVCSNGAIIWSNN